jgi:hypothetical protein
MGDKISLTEFTEATEKTRPVSWIKKQDEDEMLFKLYVLCAL